MSHSLWRGGVPIQAVWLLGRETWPGSRFGAQDEVQEEEEAPGRGGKAGLENERREPGGAGPGVLGLGLHVGKS